MKKLCFAEVKDFIESQSYKCLSDSYDNSRSKLLLECPQGHIFEITFSNFKYNGNRCGRCSNKLKYTLNEVKTYIEKFDYTFLSKQYINNSSKLKLLCNNDHIIYMSFSDFKRGNRCNVCYRKNNIGKNHPSWKENRDDIDIRIRLRKNFKHNWIVKNMKSDKNYNKYLLNPTLYQVDHIIPITAFCPYISKLNMDESKIKQIANHRRNLQLLTEEENRIKFNKYDETELNEYIKLYY